MSIEALAGPLARAIVRRRGIIAVAWIVTLPAAALIGGLVYAISSAFGSGAAGPLVVAIALLAVLGVVFARRVAQHRRLVAAQ